MQWAMATGALGLYLRDSSTCSPWGLQYSSIQTWIQCLRGAPRDLAAWGRRWDGCWPQARCA